MDGKREIHFYIQRVWKLIGIQIQINSKYIVFNNI